MEYMEIAFLAGRVLYGGFLAMMALNHFTKRTALAQYAAMKGVPAPGALVPLSGLVLLLGALGILLGIYIEYAIGLIALFFVPVTFQMHNFWADVDPMQKMNNMTHFLKNVELLGAALMFLMIPQPWPFGLM